MRFICTLFSLFVAFSCFAQAKDSEVVVTAMSITRTPKEACSYITQATSKDTSKVIVINCWGNKKNIANDTLAPQQGARIRLCSFSTLPTDGLPLIVVNGTIYKGKSLKDIDPNEIQKIEILKGPKAAVIYGPAAVYGVILITTKLTYKQITVKDAVDKSPVPGATISFDIRGRENVLRYIADEKGVVLSNSWKELANCKMTVSAMGYKPIAFNVPGNNDEIFLERNVITCAEVIITQTYCPKRCVTLYCRCSGIYIKNDSVVAEKANPSITGFNIYPNPVKAGAGITIQFNEPDNVSAIRVLSLDGRTLLQRPVARVQKNIFRLDTDPRWAAGIYFVQLLYENGRVAASEKIILQ